MWTPKYINIKNLFAHVDTKYEFKPGVCTVIFGENRDDEDAENNGAGKSTLFEGIAIALTGKSLRDIDKEVFINRYAEDCEVEMMLSNKALRTDLKIIRRFYRGGKSSKVELYENGKLNSQLVSVNEANARIIDLLGVTRDDLLRYFIISQDNRYQFFTAGDVEKKEVLNRITNADMINPILDKLNTDKKDLSSRISDEKTQLSRYEGKLELFKEQRKEAVETDDNSEIVKREERISELKQKSIRYNDERKEVERDINLLQKQYDAMEVTDTTEIEAKRDALRKKLRELEEQESETNHIIQHLKMQISGALKCPECGHEFVPESEYDISVDEARTALKESEGVLADIREKIVKRKLKIKSYADIIQQAEAQESRKRSLKSRINHIKSQSDDLLESAKSCSRKIKNLESEISELKNNSNKAKIIKDCDEKIAETESIISKINADIEKMEGEMSMIDYWIYYMGKQGFKTYLANRAVKIIEGICNSFLKKFHSSMRVEINGFKINKSGEVREKIDVLAVYKGLHAQNFMGYSGGERGRIYLASILGIQHLINLSLNGRGLDLLILDESLGALDSRGVVNICNILNQLGVTVLMITQNVSNDVNISNKILVVRENEVSRIEN